jgi:hypothetical protein
MRDWFGRCKNDHGGSEGSLDLDPEQDCINNYGSPPNFADDIQQVLVQK